MIVTTKRKLILAIGASVFLLAWLAVGIGFVIKVDFTTWFALVTVAALATEGLFWLITAVCGLTMFEARKSIWRAVREFSERLVAPR